MLGNDFDAKLFLQTGAKQDHGRIRLAARIERNQELHRLVRKISAYCVSRNAERNQRSRCGGGNCCHAHRFSGFHDYSQVLISVLLFCIHDSFLFSHIT
ncbi:MAG: hypothetical protein MI741_21605, partial [Rhodospirillales bacterium]|nr:hypothetical protein [Rhodospirillales bacterium]